MKKVLFLLLPLITVLFSLQSTAQIASFSFSLNSTSASYGWNDPGWTNVYGDPYTGVRTATAGGITITSINVLNWSTNTNNTCASDLMGASGGTYFPANVLRNYWYQAGATSAFNQAYPQLRLSGLNKDSSYIIRMSTSSLYNVGDPMLYTVSGRTLYPSQSIYAYNNTATGITFQQIYPDANGVISVYINTTSGKIFAALSGLQVFPGSANVGVPVVAITSPDNNDVLAEESSVTINATASELGSTISKVEFFVDTTRVGQSTTPPFQCTWTNPDAGIHTLTARATDATGTAGSAAITVSIESLSSFWSMTGNIRANADSNFLGTVDTNRLAFRTNNVERMSITKDGNVAIGTSRVPTGYMLAVKGSGIFTHLQVKSVANWPDYVFEKKYQLMTLEDLEAYIDKYKHLPDVLSVANVNAEGVDLGANQAAILKNVEELTLHLIQENKQLKAQSGKTAELENKIADQDRQISEQNTHFADLQRQIDALKGLLNKTNN